MNVAASDAALTDVLCAENVKARTDLKDHSGLLIHTAAPRGLVRTPDMLPVRPLNIRYGAILDWIRDMLLILSVTS